MALYDYGSDDLGRKSTQDKINEKVGVSQGAISYIPVHIHVAQC